MIISLCHGDFTFRRLLKTGAGGLGRGKEMCCSGLWPQTSASLGFSFHDGHRRPHFDNMLLLMLSVKMLFISSLS